MLALLACLFLISSAICSPLWEPTTKNCAVGCMTSLSQKVFKGYGNTINAPCKNVLLAQSFYLCAREYCSIFQTKAGIEHYTIECAENGYKILPMSIIDDLTEDVVAKFPVLELDDLELPDELIQPVLLSQDVFNLGFKTVDQWSRNSNTHNAYGCALIGFWILVLIVGTCSRMKTDITTKRTEKVFSDLENSHALRSQYQHGMWMGVHRYWQQYLKIPATFSKHCREPIGQCTVPPRIQSATILIFIIMNIFLSCGGYQTLEGNLYWSSTSDQLWRYISDRTGILAAANFTMIWLFAQRNNVVLLLTHWSFATYINFHRWIARVAVVQAIVHSVGYSYLTVKDGNYFENWVERDWWCGGVATITMSLMLGLSVYQLRHKVYEVFLILHIVFALATLVGLYFHLHYRPEYRVYIWPSIFFWILDRFLRVVRILLLNVAAINSSSTAFYDRSADIIHLDVPNATTLKPQAGEFYYIYLLHGWKVWESHPFTLNTWTSVTQSPKTNSTNFQSPSMSVNTKVTSENERLPLLDSCAMGETSEPYNMRGKGARQTLNFIIRPYESFTARFRDLVTQQPTNHAKVHVLIEGPYGTPLSLSRYSKVVFVVGGTGLVVPLSYLCSLRNQRSELRQEVHIVWAIRQKGMLISALNRDLGDFFDYFPKEKLRMEVYITGFSDIVSSSTVDPLCEVARSRSSGAYKMYPNLHVHSRRPDISKIISLQTDTATDNNELCPLVPDIHEEICVVSCGPASMADETRRAVAESIKLKPGTEFMDEGFGW